MADHHKGILVILCRCGGYYDPCEKVGLACKIIINRQEGCSGHHDNENPAYNTQYSRLLGALGLPVKRKRPGVNKPYKRHRSDSRGDYIV